jgi:hypothetical protein
VGEFPGKIENRQNFTKKSHLVKTSSPAVNEKGEFAGNVQFVAVEPSAQTSTQHRQCQPYSTELSYKHLDNIIFLGKRVDWFY